LPHAQPNLINLLSLKAVNKAWVSLGKIPFSGPGRRQRSITTRCR